MYNNAQNLLPKNNIYFIFVQTILGYSNTVLYFTACSTLKGINLMAKSYVPKLSTRKEMLSIPNFQNDRTSKIRLDFGGH